MEMMAAKRRPKKRATKPGRERIGRRMAELGMTAPALAARLKCGRSTAYKYQQGSRFPERENWQQVADALDWSIAELNGWRE